MIGYLCLAVGILGQWLFGVAVGEKLLASSSHFKPSRLELIGLGCILGVGVNAWILFVVSWCGAPLGFSQSFVINLVGFLTGGPVLLKWLRSQKTRDRNFERESNRDEKKFVRVVQGLIVVLFVTCLLQTLQTPQKLWDERAIFALKARVLYEDRSLRSPALIHPDFVQYHPRYPLLLPLAEEHIYALLGTVDDRISKIIFTQLYCGMVLTFAGVLLRYFSPSRAWLGTLILATVPVMMPYEYGFLCGQADAPVACYHGLSVLYLWDGLQRQKSGCAWVGPWAIAGVCGGLAAFTKDEGIAYLIIDSSILILFGLGAAFFKTRSFQCVFLPLIFTVISAVVISPWFLHRRSLPLTTEMNYFGRMTLPLFMARLETLIWSVPHLTRRMFWEWSEWGLQWWLMLFGFASRPTRALELPQLILVMDVAGSIASLLVAGMLAPAQLDEHIGGSSHRFLMQISPVAILFAITMFPDSDCFSNNGGKKDMSLSTR